MRIVDGSRQLLGGRWLRWLGTLISSALFVWLLARQDWARTWDYLTHLPVWLLPLAFALYFLSVMGNSLRWYILLRSQGIPVPYPEVLKVVITGAFASNFLPSTVGGDSVRILSLARFTANWTAGIATVFMDRVLGVMVMVTVLPFTFTSFGSLDNFIDALSVLNRSGWGLALAAVGLEEGLISRWRSKAANLFAKLRDTFRIWRQRPAVLGLAFVVSWFSRFMTFLALWSLAGGLGIQVTIFQVMGVSAVTYLLTMLPISLNGYGVREISLTSLYVFLGASVEQATALAVISRFITLIETLPGSLWLSDLLPAEKAADTLADS